ncbi:MAG: 50S ribosomal protein L32 [Bacilli bacterium]|jgi:large subunit ribosomal protein L32|nr:50S ribosomal protein L32 [Bacilli bacterium]
MAVPKRRTGVTRKHVRRQHLALKATNLIPCPNCGEMIRPHHVCPKCGFYDGKKVMDVKEEK